MCVLFGAVLFVCRWNELQCSPPCPVGNFTPSGRNVKVTSGHKVAQKEAFSFVVGHIKRVSFSFLFFVCLCDVCDLLLLKTTLLKYVFIFMGLRE